MTVFNIGGIGTSPRMKLLYTTTLTQTTQSVQFTKDMGNNPLQIKDEVAIYFRNLQHAAASGTCGIAMQFNNINTGNSGNMVSGGSNVQPSNTSYTYDGIIYGRRSTDKSWVFIVAGQNSGANIQGTTVGMGQLANSNIGDIYQLFISCSSYGTYSMAANTQITVYGR